MVPAQMEVWPETVRLQGSLLAFEEAVVGSKLPGRVASVSVDIGSIVKAGQTLVSLVRTELDLRVQLAESQLAQACAAIGLTPAEDENRFDIQQAPGVMMEQALLIEARANLDRSESLIATRAITQGEHDTLLAQQKAAQARYNAALNLVREQISTIGVRRKELALARQAVIDSQVLAPFDGVIGSRRVSPGEFVQAGQAVVTLVRSDKLRFTAGVPESRAGSVRVGQAILIALNGKNSPQLKTTISRVSPSVTQSNRSVLIQADVPNDDLALRAGLFVEAELVLDSSLQAIVVPSSAVIRFAGVEKVWQVIDGVSSQQTVRTGRSDGGRVEILEGLPAESLVISNAAEGNAGPVVVLENPRTSLQAKFPAGGSQDNASSSAAQ